MNTDTQRISNKFLADLRSVARTSHTLDHVNIDLKAFRGLIARLDVAERERDQLKDLIGKDPDQVYAEIEHACEERDAALEERDDFSAVVASVRDEAVEATQNPDTKLHVFAEAIISLTSDASCIARARLQREVVGKVSDAPRWDIDHSLPRAPAEFWPWCREYKPHHKDCRWSDIMDSVDALRDYDEKGE